MAAELDSPEPAHGTTLSGWAGLLLACCTSRSAACACTAACCQQNTLADLGEEHQAVMCSAGCVTSHAGCRQLRCRCPAF